MGKIDLLSMNMPELDLLQSCIGLLFCMIASFILRSVYINRSQTISGKFHIGNVIPILSTVTFLVIIVVKSSLALSLGLVGALSIVRFRTPIKEPEELVYLFLAIGLGLGYGAGQYAVTTLVYFVIIAMIILFLSRKGQEWQNEFNLVVENHEGPLSIEQLSTIIRKYSESLELTRIGTINNTTSAFFKAVFKTETNLDALASELKTLGPRVDFSISEARLLQ